MELRNQQLFETFMRLLAGRVGQPVNLSGLAGEVGVSGTTLKQPTTIPHAISKTLATASWRLLIDCDVAVGLTEPDDGHGG